MPGTSKEALFTMESKLLSVRTHHHQIEWACGDGVASALYCTSIARTAALIGSSGGTGTCTLGAAQATHVGMAALQLQAVKLEAPPPPTGGARSTHKRELVHPTSTASWGGRGCFLVQLTEDLIDTAQTLHEETDCVPSPSGQSSMEGFPSLSFPTVNFFLSFTVSCASILSTTSWPRMTGSSWNSVMFLFLATPFTAATPNWHRKTSDTPEYCSRKQ